MATNAICTHECTDIPDGTPAARLAHHDTSTTDRYPAKPVTEYA